MHPQKYLHKQSRDNNYFPTEICSSELQKLYNYTKNFEEISKLNLPIVITNLYIFYFQILVFIFFILFG